MPMPPGTQPSEPSATTGAARTTELGNRPGCATIGRASWVRRSQLAVLLASQTPLKSGFPATRPMVSVGAAGAARVGRPVTRVKNPAVAAAAERAIAKLLPESRIGIYLIPHTTTIGRCFEAAAQHARLV